MTVSPGCGHAFPASQLGWCSLKHLTDPAPGSTSKTGCETAGGSSGFVDISIALKCFGQILVVFTQVNLWLWVLPEGFVSQIGALTSKEPVQASQNQQENYYKLIIKNVFFLSYLVIILSFFPPSAELWKYSAKWYFWVDGKVHPCQQYFSIVHQRQAS